MSKLKVPLSGFSKGMHLQWTVWHSSCRLQWSSFWQKYSLPSGPNFSLQTYSSLRAKHLLYKWPPRSYVAIVPNMTSIKQKRIMMSTIIGKLFKMVDTKELIPGIELIVLKGLRILITLIAEISDSDKPKLTQPKTTTKKSSYIENIN